MFWTSLLIASTHSNHLTVRWLTVIWLFSTHNFPHFPTSPSTTTVTSTQSSRPQKLQYNPLHTLDYYSLSQLLTHKSWYWDTMTSTHVSTTWTHSDKLQAYVLLYTFSTTLFYLALHSSEIMLYFLCLSCLSLSVNCLYSISFIYSMSEADAAIPSRLIKWMQIQQQ